MLLATAPNLSPCSTPKKQWRHHLAAGAVARLTCTKAVRRRQLMVGSSNPARGLWGDPGSQVQSIDLDSFRLMHRASFSHRNLRTYVIVVYVPGSTRCAEIEHEMERLATGLSNEPRVVVAKLNALGSNGAFLFSTSVLEVKQYPTIFLYPEGTPGCMRFTGAQVTSETILAAINGCFKKVFPNRQSLELSSEAVVQTSPQLAPKQQQQQSMVRSQAPVLQSLTSEVHGYWSPGKLAFWGFVTLFSVGALCWDRWGEGWWLQRGLMQRQQQRKEGVAFDEDTNVEDLLNLSLLNAPPQTKEQVMNEVDRGGVPSHTVDASFPPGSHSLR